MRQIVALIVHEARLLFRARVLIPVILVLLPALALSFWNSRRHVERLEVTVTVATETDRTTRSRWIEAAELRAAGKPTPGFPSWRDPSSPVLVGGFMGALATLPPRPLAVLAISESNAAPSAAKVNLRNASSLFDHDEIASAGSLSEGSLDPSFVLVLLLPLVVLALGFDLIAQERERGTLRLLRAVPLPLPSLLAAKALVRGGALFAICFLALLAGLAISVPSLRAIPASIAGLIALAVLVYIAFWLGVCALLNTWRRSSSALAVIAAATWVFLTLWWPGAVRTAMAAIAPAPSRPAMLVELRANTVAAEKSEQETLAAYLKEHPELAPQSKDEWQRGFLLVQEQVDARMAPTLRRFAAQRRTQAEALAQASFLSPPALLGELLTEVAGTGRDRHDVFIAQTEEFQREWIARFKAWTMEQKKLTSGDLRSLPAFRFEERASSRGAWFLFAKLALVTCATWAAALLRARKLEKEILL